MIEIIGNISMDHCNKSTIDHIFCIYHILEKSEIITMSQNTIYLQILRKAIIYLGEKEVS
jgi:hypothetical protein